MNLFDPVRIGTLEAKNHFLRSATYEGAATEDGRPTDKILSLYQGLARGGVGTILTSYTYIADYEQPAKNQLGIYCDDMIPDYQKVVDAVHALGSKIFMQIVHGSSHSQGYPDSARILGPSALVHPTSGLTPQEMTKDDIRAVVQLFADAAVRVKKAGFDGVQIHCAHGYLLSHFISPIFNRRTDEYGGSVENRLRIVLEVYHAIRKAVGPDYPVWIKINSSDEMPGGLTVEEFLPMGQALAEAGIDAIEISGLGWRSHTPDERAYYKDAAVRLAGLVDTPVILTGGLRSMQDILPIYQHSRVSLFGFARPFMADPNFLHTLQKQI